MKLKFTHRGGFRVFRDRVEESTHKTEREALQAAICVKQCNPDAAVRVVADYEVDVETED